jgi:hypothetical protein
MISDFIRDRYMGHSSVEDDPTVIPARSPAAGPPRKTFPLCPVYGISIASLV